MDASKSSVCCWRAQRSSGRGRPEASDPFFQDEHTALKDLLEQHQLALADFRQRCLEAGWVRGRVSVLPHT